jgi:DNA-directed RNA polymerase specialized sigma24 family protein
MDVAQPSERADAGQAYFNTTHWSLVQSARDGESEQAAQALAQLCSCYWYPLYSFVRRRGLNHHDAEDLTQAFFHRLLDRNYLSAVDYRKGRFRTFLLVALERFMANEWRRAHAHKRGGQASFVSMDEPAAEQRYLLEPAPGLSPENIYDQNCALALLERTLNRLRREFEAEGKVEKFDRLKGFLTTDGEQTTYAALAEQTHDTVAALKMAVSRLRARYGELLREEVANTLSSPQEVEDELNALLTALSY